MKAEPWLKTSLSSFHAIICINPRKCGSKIRTCHLSSEIFLSCITKIQNSEFSLIKVDHYQIATESEKEGAWSHMPWLQSIAKKDMNEILYPFAGAGTTLAAFHQWNNIDEWGICLTIEVPFVLLDASQTHVVLFNWTTQHTLKLDLRVKERDVVHAKVKLSPRDFTSPIKCSSHIDGRLHHQIIGVKGIQWGQEVSIWQLQHSTNCLVSYPNP